MSRARTLKLLNDTTVRDALLTYVHRSVELSRLAAGGGWPPLVDAREARELPPLAEALHGAIYAAVERLEGEALRNRRRRQAVFPVGGL